MLGGKRSRLILWNQDSDAYKSTAPERHIIDEYRAGQRGRRLAWFSQSVEYGRRTTY